jgi:hypothetical protein
MVNEQSSGGQLQTIIPPLRADPRGRVADNFSLINGEIIHGNQLFYL